MSTRKITLMVFAGLIAVLLQGTAWAQAASNQPCRADLEKLCKGVAQGGGRLSNCLREHASELSPGCKAKLDAGEGIFSQGAGANGAAAMMMQACGDDQKKLCGKIQSGGGRIRQCLKEHLSELSPKCKEVIQETSQGARRRAGGFRTACREELGKLCRGTEPGGGRLMECLKKHDGELSANCKKALGEAQSASQKAKTK
jgi:hypothetical protein